MLSVADRGEPVAVENKRGADMPTQLAGAYVLMIVIGLAGGILVARAMLVPLWFGLVVGLFISGLASLWLLHATTPWLWNQLMAGEVGSVVGTLWSWWAQMIPYGIWRNAGAYVVPFLLAWLIIIMWQILREDDR